MAQNEQIVLDVKFNGEGAAQSLARLQAELQALKDKQAEANKAIKEGNQLTEEQAADYAVTAQRIAETKTAINAASSAIQEANKSTQANNGSIASMRQELSHLTKQYDSLSAEQRNNADIGGALKSRINELTDELKGLESATGRNQRNVGNYTQSILEATKGMGGLGRGVQGAVQPFSNLNNGMKAMAANPWMALISVAVTIVLKLTEAFKKNGAAMESLNKVFGIFQGIGVIVDKLIDKIAGGVAKLADGMINLAKRLGIVNEEMETGLTLAQEQLRLAEQSRKVRMEEADTAAEIAELREKASDKENHSLQERIDALNEAQEKENAIAKQREAIAKREYELAKQVADQANSSQEELDKVADAYVKWQNEIANTANANRQLNKQINAMNKEAEREAAQRAREAALRAKERRAQAEADRKERMANEKDIAAQLEDIITKNIEDETERSVALRQLQGEREVEALQQRLDTEKNLTDKAKEDLKQLIVLKQKETEAAVKQIADDAAAERLQKQKDDIKRLNEEIRDLRTADLEETSQEWLDNQMAILNEQMEAELAAVEGNEEAKLLVAQKYAELRSQVQQQHSDAVKGAEDAEAEAYRQSLLNIAAETKTVFNGLTDLADAFAKDEKKAAKAKKALGLANVAIDEGLIISNTAAAISTAVKAATNAGLATGVAAPIFTPILVAEMVAAVLSGVAGTAASIAKAKNIIGGAFAEGGIVGGSSYQGDRVITRTNSGEMILTKSQQAQLFSIANGGQTSSLNYEAMGAMMREAFAAAPAPVMDYSEFTQFQKNVANYKEIASL